MMLRGWREWTIAAGMGLLVYFVHAILGLWATPSLEVVSVSDGYEMQRVKNDYNADFDLTNRTIETTRIGGGHTVPAPVSQGTSANGKKNVVWKNTPVVKADAKKVADAKKQKEQAKKKKEELARRQRQGGKLSVKVVDSRFRRTLSDSGSGDGLGGAAAYGNGYGTVNMNPAVNAAKSTDKPPEDFEQKLSAGQWFSLLQAQPTQANARKFLVAKADLGIASYYDIISKLLRDSQADRTHIAIYILNSDISIMSFQYLVKLPEDIQKNLIVAVELQQILASYGKDKSHFGILAQALNASDITVVTVAMDMVVKASLKVSQGNTASGTGAAGLFAKGDFNVFKTTLEKLVKSSNAKISQSAKDVYGTIWQLPTVTASTQP